MGIIFELMIESCKRAWKKSRMDGKELAKIAWKEPAKEKNQKIK